MPKRQRPGNRKRGVAPRRVDVREIRQRFLIVCEGERTEPNYFRAFRVPGLVVQVEGVARQALRLVEHAIELRAENEYDQVWCVFDRDDVPAGQFNEAVRLAQHEGCMLPIQIKHLSYGTCCTFTTILLLLLAMTICSALGNN